MAVRSVVCALICLSLVFAVLGARADTVPEPEADSILSPVLSPVHLRIMGVCEFSFIGSDSKLFHKFPASFRLPYPEQYDQEAEKVLQFGFEEFTLAFDGSFGKSGDPAYAYSGTNIWGNDLGPSGWNGAYQNGVDNSLLSPALDLSDASGATLRFQRWLTIESGQYDQGTVLVNGTSVWTNPVATDLVDTSWVAEKLPSIS